MSHDWDLPLIAGVCLLWVARQRGIIFAQDLDAVRGNVLSWHHGLLEDVSRGIEDIYHSIAGMHTRKLQHLADDLGSLEAAEEWRRDDCLDVLVKIKNL